MRFSDSQVESRIAQIECDMQGKASSHELSALRSNVDSMERINRKLSTCIDELRATCEALLQRIEILERNINEGG